MNIDVITLFPDFFASVFSQSILKRALESNIVNIKVHDLRKYTSDKHHQADDYLYGGGPGMLLKPEPVFRAFEDILEKRSRKPLIVFPSAQGKVFKQKDATGLALREDLIFLCGHYKGIDQRITERWVDREYSLGDYVVTGGEVASMVILDAIIRLIPGVLGDLDSALGDSFQVNKLDCFHYTRPEDYNDYKVPDVLLSGHHGNIESWRRSVADAVTAIRRPDISKD